ncbi:MAG: type II toxin-antitoxin system CcdA family antitoxin [Acidimicrobiales bacterium]
MAGACNPFGPGGTGPRLPANNATELESRPSRRIGLCDAQQHVCILCGVTRLNVYLPDDLAAEAKKAGLNLSAVTQEAVRRSLALRSTDAWLETLASPTERVSHDRALAALDAARDEAPTRHG